MRLALVFVLVAPAVALADPQPHASDPAFLGIGMHDVSGACVVDTVTPDTGAALAGLHAGDVISTLDHHPIADCGELTQVVVDHAAGDAIAIGLLGGRAITAQLTTRADVMRHRMLGHRIDAEVDATDGNYRALDLDHRAIVGWFAPLCADCAAVFAKVDRWNHAHAKLPLYGATFVEGTYTPSHEGGDGTDAKLFADGHKVGVPLLRTNAPNTHGTATPIVFDDRRIVFTVLDEAGRVTYLAPIAPGADDVDAALEDMFLAIGTPVHAQHASTTRR